MKGMSLNFFILLRWAKGFGELRQVFFLFFILFIFFFKEGLHRGVEHHAVDLLKAVHAGILVLKLENH